MHLGNKNHAARGRRKLGANTATKNLGSIAFLPKFTQCRKLNLDKIGFFSAIGLNASLMHTIYPVQSITDGTLPKRMLL
jgi:hypothetical protein